MPKPRAESVPRVSFVGAGSGDPELVTVRGRRLIAEADVVFHDHACIAVVEACAGELEGRESATPERRPTRVSIAPETSAAHELVARANEGARVVRVVEGDPTLFGAIADEAAALARAKIPFEIVPGVPSFVVAASRAGVVLEEGTAVLTGVAIVRLESDSILDRSTETTAIPWPPRRGARSETGTLAALTEREGGQMLVVGASPTLPWLEPRPLFGRAVLVTRAREQASETSRALRARGAIPIELPTIVIGPPDDPAPLRAAVRALSSYDVVALTSANGVDALFDELARAELDARAFGAARIAAIGPGTARALARRGVRADLQPEEHRGEALAADVLRALATNGAPTGKRVLLPRAAVARDAFPEALRAAGVVVDVIEAYRTRPPADGVVAQLRETLEKRALDAVVFTASSTVEQLFAVVPDARALLQGVTVATIGPITSAACAKVGLAVDVEASPYTIPALLDALEAHFA